MERSGALAAKLNPEQITHRGDGLIVRLQLSTDEYAMRAAANGLAAIVPKMSSDQRLRTAEAMIESIPRAENGEITEPFGELMRHLEPDSKEHILTETIEILMDYYATSDSYFRRNNDGTIYEEIDLLELAVMAGPRPRTIAAMLLHPACIGEPREWMLQRFEELVFHDGNRVFLNLPEEDGERQGNYKNPPSAIPVAGANEHGGLTPNRSPAAPPHRRFHSVHDAAAWIQQNWPDFDLEATHPVVWRGEL